MIDKINKIWKKKKKKKGWKVGCEYKEKDERGVGGVLREMWSKLNWWNRRIIFEEWGVKKEKSKEEKWVEKEEYIGKRGV